MSTTRALLALMVPLKLTPFAVAETIRAARTEKKLSQVALAVHARVSLSTVRLAERGVYTTKTLNAVARALGVSVDALTGRQVQAGTDDEAHR